MRFHWAIAAMLFCACAVTDAHEPNTRAICQQAVECGVFEFEQLPACNACLEHWAEQINEDIKKQVPPPNAIDCKLLDYVAKHKRIAECVSEDWWEVVP